MEVNRFLAPLAHLPRPIRIPVVRWLIERFMDVYADLHASGGENLPKGPALFISNHLSNADALILNRAFRRFGYRRRVVFLAGVKLQGETMTRLGLETVPTVAIRPNSPDREAIREAIHTLERGDSLFVFPEGGRSRAGSMIEGKPGVLLIARKSGVPIVPIGLEGTENLLAIKEGAMGKEALRRARVSVTIGPPFVLADLEAAGQGSDQLLTALMSRIATLVNPEYRGVYADV